MKHKIYLLAIVITFLQEVSLLAATVENVCAVQRPRSNIVEIFYDLVAPEGGVFDVDVSIAGGGDYPKLVTLSGDVGTDILPGRNKKIEWYAGVDWPQHVQSNFVATVTAISTDVKSDCFRGMVRIPRGRNIGISPSTGKPYTNAVEMTLYMDKSEVTYRHWKRVYDWAVAHGYSFGSRGEGKSDNHPVHSISWYDCLKWCNARSEMEGRVPACRVNGAIYRTGEHSPTVDFDCDGYRLPTKNEWRYAARGGLRSKRFPWGNSISHIRANYCGDSDQYDFDKSKGCHPLYNDGVTPYTSPVGSFAPNGFGLYDMAGNVSEWALDTEGVSEYVRRWNVGGDWHSSCIVESQGALIISGGKTTGFRAVCR